MAVADAAGRGRSCPPRPRRMGGHLPVVAIAVTAAFLSACIYDGLVIADQSSASIGPSKSGRIYHAARLPRSAKGHRIPERWSDRGLNFGVDELVETLVYVGRQLQFGEPQRQLAVGDLSREFGGRSQWHRSHQTGRDVDLLFFVTDAAGNPVYSDEMWKHDSDGAVRDGDNLVLRRFDVEANWRLVSALIDNPISEVQYIFVQDDLRQMLLEHAEASGVSRSLYLRAAAILRQPSDSAPHDDHFHVRIFCPDSDVPTGCEDFGQRRWVKRDRKYGGRLARIPLERFLGAEWALSLPLHPPL